MKNQTLIPGKNIVVNNTENVVGESIDLERNDLNAMTDNQRHLLSSFSIIESSRQNKIDDQKSYVRSDCWSQVRSVDRLNEINFDESDKGGQNRVRCQSEVIQAKPVMKTPIQGNRSVKRSKISLKVSPKMKLSQKLKFQSPESESKRRSKNKNELKRNIVKEIKESCKEVNVNKII